MVDKRIKGKYQIKIAFHTLSMASPVKRILCSEKAYGTNKLGRKINA
jgi:hypothetical protein